MIAEILELRQLLPNRKLSADELAELQNRKLRAVIHHAYENVPYYRSLFSSVGLSPGDIFTVEDLKHVPVTTKDDLRTAGVERTTTKGLDLASCHTQDTSGTTGKPFTTYLTDSEARIQKNVAFRALLSIGIRPRDRLTVLDREKI